MLKCLFYKKNRAFLFKFTSSWNSIYYLLILHHKKIVRLGCKNKSNLKYVHSVSLQIVSTPLEIFISRVAKKL